ncbi:MAG: hypothetical protein H7Y18_01940 [Clostridiaceae bacterium]|nr:hypothetical protein [Clostridiaceae bacterium]
MINKCPACGKSAMTISKKLFSKRGNEFKCKECGTKVKISVWDRIVQIVAILGALFFAMFAIPLTSGWITGIIIFLVLYTVAEIVMPLEKS